jgi:O-antigen/teichoic acid export membrane protein
MSTNLAINFFRNSYTSTTVRILGRGLGYLAQILLARLLAPEGFGLFAIGWTILRLFSIAGHLGLDIGAIHFGSKYYKRDITGLRSIFVFSTSGALFSGVCIGLLIYYFSPWIATVFFKKPDLVFILQGFAFTFPFATLLRVLAATSSISGKMLCGGVAEDLIQPIAQIGLLFLGVIWGVDGIVAAMISTVVSYVIAVLFGLVCIYRLVPEAISSGKVILKDVVALFTLSIPSVLAVTLAGFNLWGDRLIVGYFGSESDAGVYQSISLITMFTTIILSGLKTSIAPMISQLFHTGALFELCSLGKMTTRWALYLSIPVLLVAALVPSDIINLVFGTSYLSGAIPLFWLTLGQFFYVAFGLGDQFFLLTKNNKDWLAISASVFSLTIALDVIFIPRLGLLGAAIVSCGMMLTIGLMTLIRLKQKLNFWLVDSSHLQIGFAAVLAWTITYSLMYLITLAPIFRVGVAGLVSTVVFLRFVSFFGMPNEDVDILKKIYFRILKFQIK